ncbi:MAG: hypothetical protein AAGD05_08990, partial [Bacteroidota bacterium]
PECNPLTLSKYANIGNWHNDFLTNIDENFIPNNSPTITYTQKINAISAFNQDYATQLGLNLADQKDLQAEIENFKELVDRYVAYDRFFESTDILDNLDLYGLMAELKSLDIIDEFELNLINNLLDLVKANHAGSLSINQLNEALQGLQAEWIAQGYTECGAHGEFSAMVLSISLASVEWWLSNPGAGNIVLRVAPWVAADVGGAIYGAGAGALGSYLINGEVSWKATAWASLAGAVGASTGIAGKIGKWLFG